MHKAFSRRIVGLAAAYVIALQALLLPLSVAVGGAYSFSLCSAGASVASSQSQAGHQSGCPCAAGCGMQCCGHALAGQSQTPVARARISAGTRMAIQALLPAARATMRGPQVARGPPAG